MSLFWECSECGVSSRALHRYMSPQKSDDPMDPGICNPKVIAARQEQEFFQKKLLDWQKKVERYLTLRNELARLEKQREETGYAVTGYVSEALDDAEQELWHIAPDAIPFLLEAYLGRSFGEAS